MSDSPKSPTIEDLQKQLAESQAIIRLIEQQRERASAEARTLEIHLALVRDELEKTRKAALDAVSAKEAGK